MTTRPDPGTPFPPPGVRRVADVQLRGRSGPLPARAYWPPGAAPALLALLPPDGGRAGLDRADARARALCARVGAVVLAVGYRPPAGGDAAVEDARTAAWWAQDHAGELGATPDRFLVAGEGAGAGLAVAVARRALAEGWPLLARLVLICPGLDPGPHGKLLAGLPPGTTVVTAGRGGAPSAGSSDAGVEELRYGDLSPDEVLAPGGGAAVDRVADDLGRVLAGVRAPVLPPAGPAGAVGSSGDTGGDPWS